MIIFSRADKKSACQNKTVSIDWFRLVHYYGRKQMKKFFLALVAIFAFTGVSNAQFNGPSAVANTPMTIKQALSLQDDSKVVLQGHIINGLGDEKYTFSDGTDQIVVEIDDEDWAGRKVTPENTVEIFGEVDKDTLKPTEIDVDSFTVK